MYKLLLLVVITTAFISCKEKTSDIRKRHREILQTMLQTSIPLDQFTTK